MGQRGQREDEKRGSLRGIGWRRREKKNVQPVKNGAGSDSEGG